MNCSGSMTKATASGLLLKWLLQHLILLMSSFSLLPGRNTFSQLFHLSPRMTNQLQLFLCRAIRSIFPGVLLAQVVPKVEVVPVTRIKPVLEMKPLDFKDMVWKSSRT